MRGATSLIVLSLPQLLLACGGEPRASTPPAPSASAPQAEREERDEASAEDDAGAALAQGEFDRRGARAQARAARRAIQRDCARWMDPDVSADLVFAPETGKVREVRLSSERLGEVGACIEQKLRAVTVPPFVGSGAIRVQLSPPARATNRVPRP